MKKFVHIILFSFFSFNLTHSALLTSSFEDNKKQQMIKDLEILKHHIEVGYAPFEWKKEFLGWDLNEAFEEAKDKVISHPTVTTKQFQQIVRHFIKSLKDFHVGLTFFSTEASSLPFAIRGVEDRYFIDWVDAKRLPYEDFGLAEGDELLEFGDQPISKVIQDLIEVSERSSNPNTERRLAEIKLTERLGKDGDTVPQGSILITTFSSKTGKINTHQLHWDYSPEWVKNPLDDNPLLQTISILFNQPKKSAYQWQVPNLLMANPMHHYLAEYRQQDKGGLASRMSYLPNLGQIIWSNEINVKENDLLPFWHAYIYQHPNGYHIGYVRIPHYFLAQKDLNEFSEIIQKMENSTDALVIDQLHNFGGSVYAQYRLLSYLTPFPLQTPLHQVKITQKQVMESYQFLNNFNQKDKKLFPTNSFLFASSDNQIENNLENLKVTLNYQEKLFYCAYCQHLIDEWNLGHTLTSPIHLLGVDKINPNPNVQYTKGILILIDELDFSGGDFVPAILQDNQRALLFGSRTAGAGGFVQITQFPNQHGIDSFNYTGSLAERVNEKKIENLGVMPDIPYELTLKDLTRGYWGYVRAINKTIESLLENSRDSDMKK